MCNMERPNNPSNYSRPDNGRFSPRHQGFSPRHPGASPRHHGASPRHQGASPRHQGASPRHQGFSPRNQGSSPRHRSFSQPWKQGSSSHEFTPAPSKQFGSYDNAKNSGNFRQNHYNSHRGSNPHHKKHGYQGHRHEGPTSIEAYFSPCMLEDPWKNLEKLVNKGSEDSSGSRELKGPT